MTGETTGQRKAPLLPERYGDPLRVGLGGMGEVYRAFDRTLERWVAVKLLAPALAEDGEARRRFTREALAAARLSGHPHVVTIYDVGEWHGRPYLVMQYASGGTLAERARRGPVSRELALEWLGQAAAALDAAHRAGLVHRDVKPANLLFDERDQLKVTDFGIVRVSDAAVSAITAANALVGSVGYMAPEQLQGDTAGPPADVYALGVVAYEVLTGGRPFGGRSTAAEMNAHLTEPPPPASERGVGLPRSVDGVFARALAKDPEDRPATAAELVAELAATLRPEGAGASTAVAPPDAPPPGAAQPASGDVPTRVQPSAPAEAKGRGRGRAVVVGAVVALVLAGGAAAAMVASGGDGEPSTAGTAGETSARVITRTRTVSTPAEVRTVTTTAPAPAPAPDAGSTADPDGGGAPSLAEARSLTDRAYGLILEDRAEEALPLARSALAGLEGTGDPYEGNALNNMGVILIALDRCAEAVGFLERAQGSGTETQNRERAANLGRARSCASGGSASSASASAASGGSPSAVARARADTEASFGLIEAGREEEGLARQLRALRALEAAGDPYRGNAAYNVGLALIRLDRCAEAVPYLERSQGIGSAGQNAVRRRALEQARACG